MSGIVRDATGRPCEGVVVNVVRRPGSRYRIPESTQTRRDGVFVLQGLDPADVIAVQARIDGLGTRTAEVLFPGGEDAVVEIGF